MRIQRSLQFCAYVGINLAAQNDFFKNGSSPSHCVHLYPETLLWPRGLARGSVQIIPSPNTASPLKVTGLTGMRDSNYHTSYWYSIWYNSPMSATQKITVEVPRDLLEKAQQASGAGITQTIRTGLQLLAASDAYSRLLQWRGKVHLRTTLADLRADR